jgi:phosphoglycolate phosphatase-like HAD superfamily hydrolase
VQVPEVIARALLLDLDGTLVDTTRAVERSWRAVAAELGIDFDTVRPFLHGIPAEQVLRRMAPSLDPQQLRRLAERVQAGQADPGIPAPMTAGAARLLAQLTRHPWAIVTSGDTRLARASMAKAHIPEPAVLVTADDVTAGNPTRSPICELRRPWSWHRPTASSSRTLPPGSRPVEPPACAWSPSPPPTRQPRSATRTGSSATSTG